jgi:hypothetical protein
MWLFWMRCTAMEKNSEAGIPHVRSWLQPWNCRFYGMFKNFRRLRPQKDQERLYSVIMQWNIAGITAGHKNKK